MKSQREENQRKRKMYAGVNINPVIMAIMTLPL